MLSYFIEQLYLLNFCWKLKFVWGECAPHVSLQLSLINMCKLQKLRKRDWDITLSALSSDPTPFMY